MRNLHVSVRLESILQFIESLLGCDDFPDYPNALNGLQVEGPGMVKSLAAAVDASEETLSRACEAGVDFLLVHHGLFWDGVGPLTGPRYRKVKLLLENGMSLYSSHLPLDAHPEIGNCALLIRAMGLEPEGRFGAFKGVDLGWWAPLGEDREALLGRVEEAVGRSVRLIPGGPGKIRKLGVITGSGASLLGEAALRGLDALVTGEASHHAYHQAMEMGVNLYLAGHYATEVFGVRALAAQLGQEFSLPWIFLDLPTGM